MSTEDLIEKVSTLNQQGRYLVSDQSAQTVEHMNAATKCFENGAGTVGHNPPSPPFLVTGGI